MNLAWGDDSEPDTGQRQHEPRDALRLVPYPLIEQVGAAKSRVVFAFYGDLWGFTRL